jgi:hypothetical protein
MNEWSMLSSMVPEMGLTSESFGQLLFRFARVKLQALSLARSPWIVA